MQRTESKLCCSSFYSQTVVVWLAPGSLQDLWNVPLYQFSSFIYK